MSILKKKINYMVACINEFATRFNLSSKEAFYYLYENEGIAFLKENYDIEHTLSFDDAVDDLILICRKNEEDYCFIEEDRTAGTKIRQMMEYMIQDFVEIISEDRGIEYDVALAEVFKSRIYEKIMDEETGLYREKEFNTTAICIPSKHYMVDISERINEIKKLVDAGKYFTINRARQYGKTTTLVALKNHIVSEYEVVALDFQGLGSASYESEESFCSGFVKLIIDDHQYELILSL